ncbi:acetyl esterase/lipase [Catenuloplanes nepalensis]|uniref:Acetyl esterase/lipase n=1 Tax=Catenuloplanes nepalensis TaxID=587533 RepID=A0ABT9MXL3_9ACTN|nr:alpha/beta hydrolase [Catenuloplanes nepalensis]MDP9796181.1 acetyl esterase/lipase [Catenuloplanes nepalensis]
MRPPYDPAVEAVLSAAGLVHDAPVPAADSLIAGLRTANHEDLSVFDVVRRDITVDGYRGAALTGTVFSRPDHTGAGPGLFVLHGGGMVGGTRFTGLSLILPLLAAHDVVVVSVDYRLAPEHPDPYPVEDAYAGLTWTARNAGDLGIDPGRLIVAGTSSGGGLAAGTALLARDRGGPALLGQMLICPMLDDRGRTASARQFARSGTWTGAHNRLAWSALLGARAGTSDVSAYAAPARASDLSGLPPAFIDVGSAEVLRDEAVEFASRIWAGGGAAELHVWPGGTHAWDALVPSSPMARAAAETRSNWLGRLIAAPALV